MWHDGPPLCLAVQGKVLYGTLVPCEPGIPAINRRATIKGVPTERRPRRIRHGPPIPRRLRIVWLSYVRFDMLMRGKTIGVRAFRGLM